MSKSARLGQKRGVKTWKELVQGVVAKMPREFTLADISAYESTLAREYPDNNHIAAKIRQTLQVLRDQGVLAFAAPGRYRKLDVAPAFSLHFDPALAAGYTSRSQMARVMIETWAEMNLYCLGCHSDSLRKLPNNTPLADLCCLNCEREYQLKAKNGRIGLTVDGAQYDLAVAAAKNGNLPEYVLAEYDTRWAMLVWVRAIPGRHIGQERILARKALGAQARRAGWVGCNIVIDGLPSVDIILPQQSDRGVIRARWKAIAS